MRRRERTALAMTPLLLRLALAVIFLWAGLGKLLADVEVTRDQAIVLAAAGVRMPDHILPDPADKPTLDAPLEDPANDSDSSSEPSPGSRPVPTSVPEVVPESESAAPPPGQTAPAPGSTDTDTDEPDAGDTTPPAPPEGLGQPIARSNRIITDHAVTITLTSLTQEDADGSAEPPSDDAPTTASADAESANVAEVRRVNALILLMEKAANPDPIEADGRLPPPIWPRALTVGARPKWLAWAAAFTEIFAGFFLLIGLLTRLSAFALTTVMGVAIWLTTVGPAIQSGDALLGFLPNIPAWSQDWTHPLWQFLIFMTALALFFAGPGALALDRAIFAPSSSRDDDWDDDDAPVVRTSARDRTAFDRTP